MHYTWVEVMTSHMLVVRRPRQSKDQSVEEYGSLTVRDSTQGLEETCCFWANSSHKGTTDRS